MNEVRLASEDGVPIFGFDANSDLKAIVVGAPSQPIQDGHVETVGESICRNLGLKHPEECTWANIVKHGQPVVVIDDPE